MALAIGITTLYLAHLSSHRIGFDRITKKSADRTSDLRWPVTLTLLTGALLVVLWAFSRVLPAGLAN